MPPMNRFPITRPHPLAEPVQQRAERGEVVTVVGIAHDDIAAARTQHRVINRRAITAHRHIDSRAPLPAANSREPSVDPLAPITI